ncbi:hypothetical protein PS15p_205235 [Mucor circinelloides]
MSDYQQVSVNHHKYNYELDPDLIFNFDSQVVEYVYTDANRIRETNDIITLKALNLLDDSPQLHKIESVLCCKTNQDPYLLIICSDDEQNNYIFSHNVKTKVSKTVEFNKPIKGDITHTDMTCSPFTVAYVDRINTIDTKPSFAMVVGTKKDDATLVLLTLDSSEDVMQVELTETFKTIGKDKPDIGHITAICILTADKGDKRMGHSDPQILLGFSQGAILIYRIRAHVYSYKASRIRVPVDLSEFTEFPGYPITQLSCARSYNSLLMNVALAQEKPDEIKYQYRRSYIKVVETRGDFTRRQRAIINPPENIQSHAKILETKLIPSTTTVEDSTLQLSIIFQNGDKTYDLNIWEVSPTKINQALILAMDQQSCIDTMAKSDTVKSLKLDSSGYLNHVPQKIADIILEENEDDDMKHTTTTNSTNHSVADESTAVTDERSETTPRKTATTAEDTVATDENTAATDKNNASVAGNTTADEIINETSETFNAHDENEKAADTLENIIEDIEGIEEDQHTVDDSANVEGMTNVEDSDTVAEKHPATEHTKDIETSAKRENEDSADDESNAKRPKIEENLTISLEETTLTTVNELEASANRDPVEEAAVVKVEETHVIEFEEEVEEQQSALEVTVTEKIVLEESEQDVSAIEDDYVVIDKQDIPAKIPTENLPANTLEHTEDETSINSMDEDTLVEQNDSMSVDQPAEEQEDKTVEAFQTEDTEEYDDTTNNASSANQMVIENDKDQDADMTSCESGDGENPEYDQQDDPSDDLTDDYGQDYTDQVEDASEMFNQAAYDAIQKEEPAAMVITSSEDELEKSEQEDEDDDFDELDDHGQEDEEKVEEKEQEKKQTPSYPTSIDTLENQDLREGSYLDEGDNEIQYADSLDNDPIEDKDLLSEEGSIKFISGGELSDLNGYSSTSTPQQQCQLPQQHTPNTIDYIPVRAEDLLRLLDKEQETVSGHMDIDTHTAPPSQTTIAQSEPMEVEPEPIDENEVAYTTMLEFCFGTTNVDLDTVSQSDVDAMGSYCWHHANIQLKMFMAKYCLLHQMRNEGFLLTKELLRNWKISMTKEEIEECIALKKSMKVDQSVQFGDVFDPFSESARQKIVQQRKDYFKPAIPVDFYKSKEGQTYLDYYTTGSI